MLSDNFSILSVIMKKNKIFLLIIFVI